MWSGCLILPWPAFPASPLKFRTAGFPRCGFKASISDCAFLRSKAVKPAPGMPASLPQFASTLRALPLPQISRAQCPRLSAPPRAAVREAIASLPQGSLAPVRVMLSRSISAYYYPIRQSRRHAVTSRHCRLYPAPLPGGSAKAAYETFPTFTAVLSTRAVDHTPVGPLRPPVALAKRYQASSDYQRVATHNARLCQQFPTG